MYAAQCAYIYTVHRFFSRSLMSSATANAAERVLCVKTVMSVPVSDQFRVVSVQVLTSESQ